MFAQNEIEYSGYILTDKGVKVSPEKVKAILEMPEPKTKEEVRTLLGMATYLSNSARALVLFIPQIVEEDPGEVTQQTEAIQVV